MSNPPPAPEDSRLDPLVTPAAPAQHDCSKEAELSLGNSRHHLPEDQGAQQVPSPSRAESPTVVHQWSQPTFALKRSTTIPLENFPRPDTIHSPQLSERDSIFATHYLPSDSGANTPQLPPERVLDNERQVNLIPGLNDVSGSSSPVSKVSPHRPHVDPSHMEVDVRRHNPLRSSTLFSSPSSVSRLSLLRSSISSSDQVKEQEAGVEAQPTRSVSSEELGTKTGGSHDSLAERSPPSLADHVSHSSGQLRPPSRGHEQPMVSPEPAPPTSAAETSRGTHGEQSTSGGRISRVDSSIEANLANAEPASHVRSRKSSHYLGLFKENTTSPDHKRREDRARYQDELSVSGDRAMNPGHRNLHAPSEEEGLLRKSVSLPSLGDDPSFESPAKTDPSHQDEPDEPHKRRPPALPCSLLEEIRNFHLTPGGGRGSSFSKSIPTQYAERGRDYFQQNPHVERLSESLSSLEGDKRGESLQFEDDEGHEQISSAVYFPHERVAVSEGLDDPQQLVADSHGVQSVQLSSAEQGHELMLVAQEDNESPDQEVSRVDISFRSKNESKILHGDLSDLRSPTEGRTEKSLSTISERSYDSSCDSEFVSADESGFTDDAEITPTATPTQHSRLLSKRKSRATGPLGAVELKPYRHQVGGHTTVFRFSRRAVCKQLNNRENEFYERIERRHPDMLMFLPRYVHLG